MAIATGAQERSFDGRLPANAKEKEMSHQYINGAQLRTDVNQMINCLSETVVNLLEREHYPHLSDAVRQQTENYGEMLTQAKDDPTKLSSTFIRDFESLMSAFATDIERIKQEEENRPVTRAELRDLLRDALTQQPSSDTAPSASAESTADPAPVVAPTTTSDSSEEDEKPKRSLKERAKGFWTSLNTDPDQQA